MSVGPTRRGERKALWLLIALGAAIDLGVGFSELVIGPLVTQPFDPRGVARLVVLAAAVFAGVCLRRRAPCGAPAVSVRPPATIPLTDRGHGEVLAACLSRIRRALLEQPSDAVPLALHVGGRIVEIFWDRSPPPVSPPWQVTPSGWVWEAARDHLEILASPTDAELLPALVTLGSTPTGVLWLNLEAFRVVSLTGTPTGVERAARHLVGQLRRSAAAGTLDLQLRTAGRDHRDGSTDPKRWRRASPAQDGCSVLTARARQRAHAAGRPFVVAIAPGSSTPTASDVADSTRDSGGTSIVLGSMPNAELCLSCGDAEVCVSFLGNVRVRLDGAERGAHDVTPPAPLWDRAPASTPDGDEAQFIPVPTPDRREPDQPEVGVEVGVLGPVEARGTPEPVTGKSLELVAYLALHPDGVHEDQVRAALWPRRPLASNSWATRVSITRRVLGRGSDGSPRLARFRNHVGCVSTEVHVDLDTLAEALAHPDDVGGLHSALASVRGRPFEVSRGFEWAHRESHVTRAERLVVDAAHRLSTRALADGDWSEARWAVDRGLTAAPDSEVLLEDRRRVAAGAGDEGEPDAPPDGASNDQETETQRRDAMALVDLLQRRVASDPR